MSQRFADIAERWLDVVLRGPVEWMCACPLCGGASSLQFNVEKGMWVCFRCEQGGSAKSLVRKLGGSYSDPAVSVEQIQKALDQLKLKMKNKGQERKVYDERYLARFTGDSPHGYWEHRGFDANVREEWGLGYDPLSDRCTIAYRDEGGALLGVIERRLDNEFPRYIYPKGFDRLGSLFGSWVLAREGSDACCLVEGSTDAISLRTRGYPAVAQWGSAISLRQVRLLRRIGVREVTLFYDYDEAGRKAVQKSLEMLDGFVVYRVKWNSNKYCWHKKLCACGEHDWKTIGQCQDRELCQCGRKHEMDPAQLSDKEVKKMMQGRVLAGKRKSEWDIRRSARSRSARRRRTDG